MPSVRKQGNLSFQNNFHEQLYFLLYEVHAKYQLNNRVEAAKKKIAENNALIRFTAELS